MTIAAPSAANRFHDTSTGIDGPSGWGSLAVNSAAWAAQALPRLCSHERNVNAGSDGRKPAGQPPAGAEAAGAFRGRRTY